MLHISTAITIYILILAAVTGAVFGSFINCMAWRIAHGENVTKGKSHCAVCNHPLGALDLVPVFSYLFLKGRCRYCKEKISPRYMLTELLLATAFVSLVWHYDVSVETLRYLILACILLGLSLVDLEIYEIPDGFIVAGILIWAVTLPFPGTSILSQVKDGLLGAFSISIAMLLMSLLFDRILGKESLGGGDIKLYFMVGLYLGFARSFFNLILSCFLGIFFALVLKQKKIPFGPAISCATWLTLLIGTPIISWYVGLF